MAQYVRVPKDFNEIKQKIFLSLTKRQLISFGAAGAVGGAVYFLSRGTIGTTPGVYLAFLTMAPVALFGIYDHNGMYLEDVLKNIYEYMKKPKIKTYQTENIYEDVEKAMEYRRLKRIVNNHERSVK